MVKGPNYADRSDRMMPTFFLIMAIVGGIIPIVLMFLTDAMKVEAQSPVEINASNVYETKSMTLGNNIKNL